VAAVACGKTPPLVDGVEFFNGQLEEYKDKTMKRLRYLAVLILAAALHPSATRSQVGDGLDLTWNTIDGGGVMRSTGGALELSGTIGQPDAGRMSGGALELTGGFWFELGPGDCNEDGVTGLSDYAAFEFCLSGPGIEAPDPSCACFDFDGDSAVDLRDFAEFQSNINGQ